MKDLIANIIKKRKIVQSKTNHIKCKKGYIERSAYIKKNKIIVQPKCIKDRGTKGYGNIILASLELSIDKIDLGKYGYYNLINKSLSERHKALKKILKKEYKNNWLPLYRRLILLSTLNKRTNPKLSKIFKKDATYLKSKAI
jgi:hypothetical protein